MKKTLFILCAIWASCLFVNAKDVELFMDKTRDNIRTIETYDVTHMFTYNVTTDCAVSLKCKVFEELQDTTYYLQIRVFATDSWLIGDKILFKLSNREIITLSIADVIEHDVAAMQIKFFGKDTAMGLETTSLICVITEAQISDMVRYNVTKVRIETYNKYNDSQIKNGKFSEAIMDCYEAIWKALQTHPTIYDGF